MKHCFDKFFYPQVDTTLFTPPHSFQTNVHVTKLEFAVLLSQPGLSPSSAPACYLFVLPLVYRLVTFEPLAFTVIGISTV